MGGCYGRGVFGKEALFADIDTLRIDSLHEYSYQTMATDYLLNYDNVPSNALLFLKCTTEGKSYFYLEG